MSCTSSQETLARGCLASPEHQKLHVVQCDKEEGGKDDDEERKEDDDDDNVKDGSPGLCATPQRFPPQPRVCLKLLLLPIAHKKQFQEKDY